MNKFIYFILFLLSSNVLWSQTNLKTASKKQQKIYAEAKNESFSREYESALKHIDKLLKSDPTFLDAWILKGQILFDQGKIEEAKVTLQQVLQLDKNYDNLVYYMLGAASAQLNQYAEAASYFEQYVATNPKDQRRLERAKNHARQAKIIAELIANPVSFDPKPMSEAINTPFGEYLPSLTADGEYLVFTRNDRLQEDFFYSQKEKGIWQPAKPIKALNTDQNEGAQTVSADGRILIFAAGNRKDSYGGFDLYSSEYRNGQYTRPTNMGDAINTRARDRQPSLSSDGNTLYFESGRGGGQGGGDIWYSVRQANGTWGKAQNLGSVVNTAADDQSPFIHADGKTLYFMSKGHPGIGGFDLFMTQKQEDGTWSEPKNLGYPLNTKTNQGALVVSLDGKTAYYTSDQAPPEYGGSEDIYTFEMPESIRPAKVTYVKAIVKDAKTRQRIEGASAEFVALNTAKVYAKSLTDRSGIFLSVLPIGEDYALNVSYPNYLFHSENFALEKPTDSDKPFELEVFLTPIEKTVGAIAENKPIVLKNIFFENNKATLLIKSRIELQQLKRLLEEQPTLRIQINGHTDNVGSKEDNLNLSERRAKAVQDYLIEQGIDTERLQHKGFGERQPIADNETEIGRQKNRRTEFVVVE